MSPRTSSPTRSRLDRPKLDRATVVAAALEVADAEGLDAVTIRRLAQDLAVTPMALYWHFKDKDALLGAAAERMWEETLAELDRLAGEPGVADDGWALLRVTMDALVGVMRRHPAVAPLAPQQVLQCDAGLDVTERTLTLLSDLGFGPQQASTIAKFVLCSAVMLVDSEPGVEVPDGDLRSEVQRRKRIALASLPLSRYPHLAASAEYFTDCDDSETYFGQGIDLVIAGVRHQAHLAR